MGVFSRRQAGVAELREAVHQLTLRVKRAEDSLSLLEGQHERLRGRFYATRTPESPPQAKTKEELLRDFHAARAKGA
jgi:hypothetical protein